MDNVKTIDGKKFMWDGKEYSTSEEAGNVASEYEKSNFETRVLQEKDKHLVYTRRVVTEVVLEGEAPP